MALVYRICKAASEQKLTKTVNEFLAKGGQIVGRSYQAEEPNPTGGKGRPKIIKLFFQTMMIPDELIEKTDLGDMSEVDYDELD